ncbi:ABC transporter permease [Salipaludibacillus sp. CUR1]|uniref:ABC transporter permease n=1 Tax=Salipaludibacillus sp. CUR1 TaxID=2820003 RepID=UPI001E4226EC|nr:ABC transporter permease [Salipaludibacillus sp. CUR1]MCE7792536.1 ABC transporter permease [Salipaludibacillus sp. CUR1]
MLPLLKNEWIKLWNKKQTWIFAAAIVVIMFAITAIYYSFIEETTVPQGQNWEIALETEIAEQEEILANENEEWVLESAEQKIEENEALLAAGVDPNITNNMTFMNETLLVAASFITLFSVIAASSIVSSEIDNGTMKHLLIRPFERWQFLLAKFLTVVGFSAALFVLLVLVNLILGTLFFGAGSPSTPVMEMNFDGNNLYTTVDKVLPQKSGLYFLNLLMFIIISFSISILFKSQTLAVGIGIFILFATSISQAFTALLGETAWYKYVFLPHMDLPAYVVRDELLPGVGLGFSVGVLAVYALVFIGASTVYFQKRDLA